MLGSFSPTAEHNHASDEEEAEKRKTIFAMKKRASEQNTVSISDTYHAVVVERRAELADENKDYTKLPSAFPSFQSDQTIINRGRHEDGNLVSTRPDFYL